MAATEGLPPATSGDAALLADQHKEDHPLKLYSAWYCPFAQRAWIVLTEKKIPYQYVEVDPYLKEASFLALNPRGLVPTLALPAADADGKNSQPLYESSILGEYLDETYTDEAKYGPRLLPGNQYQRARARIWIDHISSKIAPLHHAVLSHNDKSPYKLEDARSQFHESIRTLVKEMSSDGPFFFGKEFSLVDVALAPWAQRFWMVDHLQKGGTGIPKEDGDEVWARWWTWFEAATERPSVKATWSESERYLKRAALKLNVAVP